jgi:hypothetical protein
MSLLKGPGKDRSNLGRRELLSDTRWARTYRLGPEHTYFESKFLADGLQVPADRVADEWPSFSVDERHEFALAFGCKGSYTTEDEKILDLLMLRGDETVWTNIALALARHANREIVLSFLLQRIQDRQGAVANYFQALEEINDKSVIPALQLEYQSARERVLNGTSSESECLAFLALCRALWKLSGESTFEQVIRELSSHPLELVRKRARGLLSAPP